jgi:hypothetical protein
VHLPTSGRIKSPSNSSTLELVNNPPFDTSRQS